MSESQDGPCELKIHYIRAHTRVNMPIMRLNAIRMLLIAVAIIALSPQALATPRRVLLVYQYDAFSQGALAIQRGILDRLRSELSEEPEFFCEQLEAGRLPDSQDRALELVRTRYAGQGIDVVIYLGTTPVDLLPGVPTIYSGNTLFPLPPKVSWKDHRTTMLFKVDFTKTIFAARRLQPKAKEVLVITGAGSDDHALLNEFQNQVKGMDISIDYLTDASMTEIKSRVAALPPDTIVLPLSYNRDSEGNMYSTRDVAALSQVSAAPIYAVADTTVGSGTVGGFVVSFEKTGLVIGDVAVRILRGDSVEQVVVSPEDSGSYVFDWRQLKRWGFSEDSLPGGSVVRFQNLTIWQQYRGRISAVIGLIVIQSLLIVALLVNRRNRRRAEASLHEVTGRLLESQDDERRRIARDLHDGTGQHLSGMALTIGQVLADFPSGHEDLRRLLEDSHTASRQALNEVRTVSYVLHPPILDGLGLVAALQWYLEGLKKRTDINIVFKGPADLERLSAEAERALFRIVQEGVTNVLRHSGGSALNIALSSDPKAVTLEIEDNGRGLDVEQLSQLEGEATLGVGIAGMRERIRQLHGIFKIQSNSEGTRVTASVPLDRNRYAAHHVGG